MNFDPTPEKLDRWQIKKDLEQLGRNIRLKMFYINEASEAFSSKPAFRVPSTWTPPISDLQLEIYLSEIEEQLEAIEEKGKSYPNLSKGERDALHALMSDETILIKSADKGSAAVVWDKNDYLAEAYSQLNDPEVYEKITTDPLPQVNKAIETVIWDMFNRKEISKKVRYYLLNKKPQLGRFYLLPKIHKRTENVPGRPVISNNGTATENISAFLDFHLKGILPTIPHILEDTRDFLCRIKGLSEIPNDAILVSFDVVGLYSHIPHEEGLATMKKFLDERPEKEISTSTLCKLANIVLKHK